MIHHIAMNTLILNLFQAYSWPGVSVNRKRVQLTPEQVANGDLAYHSNERRHTQIAGTGFRAQMPFTYGYLLPII
jgi:hypothetical protein